MTKVQTMSIFDHHIYEYKKGLRNLILHTVSCDFIKEIKCKLRYQEISYIVYRINIARANIFFGNEACIKVLEKFGCKKLNRLTNEEDFMLGIMLGYEQIQQCHRYLKRKDGEKTFNWFTDLSFKSSEVLV